MTVSILPTKVYTEHSELPPFPDDIPTHPLLIVDYALIKAGDQQETDRLWEAATELGFWYLKNHGVDAEANKMFNMAAETMALPLEEKMKYEQGDEGVSLGYKAVGANAVDAFGNRDTIEVINVAKDDALAWPDYVHRTYPKTVNARMVSTIAPFVRKSKDVTETLLRVLEGRLGLPDGAIMKRHPVDGRSTCEARCIRSLPRMPGERVALGSHTDFGSISFLHNRLGGLQVLAPGTDKWQYVKPLPGHAICNLGDAMALFSGGILRSNLHRVIPAPGAQSRFERWSLVYLCRPRDSVILRALVEESELIAKAVEKNKGSGLNFETGVTAGDWFARRMKNQRINNRKGPETWIASRGTEHKPLVV